MTPLPPNPSSTLLSMTRPAHSRTAASVKRINQPSPELNTPASAAAAVLDDSLTPQAMHALLEPSPGHRPPLSWSARLAKEKRRKDILQLQRWFQVEVDRLSQAGETRPEGQRNAAVLPELSSILKNRHEVCDQAITQLSRHINTGSSGGDDIASELLLEVWQLASKVAKQQQASLRAEAAAARQRAQQAERQVEQLTAQIKLHSRTNSNDSSRRDSASVPNHARNGSSSMLRASENPCSAPLGAATSPTTATSASLLSQSAVNEAIREATSELVAKNAALEGTVAVLRRDVAAITQRAAVLEAVASNAADAESRAEMAESELEEMKSQIGQLTPRPAPEYHELRALLGAESKVEIALAALQEHDKLPIEELAALLVANVAETSLEVPQALAAGAPPTETQGTATTGTAANGTAGGTTHVETRFKELSTAAESGKGDIPEMAGEKPSELPPGSAPTQPPGAEAESLVVAQVPSPSSPQSTVLASTPLLPAAVTAPSLPASQFTGALVGVPLRPLVDILSRCRGSTAQRYVSIEKAAASLRTECTGLATELETFRETERRREAARRRREEEAMLEKKNAVQQYLDLLSSQGEETWKEQLIGMGQGQEVPKLFRHSGKIRNKQMTKRDTEKLVKELWKERLKDPAVTAGRAGEVVDFVGAYLQKKLGIAAAVIELGYNFLYGLWLYQWDADCELFLKILTGEIREEVYVAQARLQTDLEELFAALDKSKGQATGSMPKEDLRTALSSFFRVGQPGGKTLARFDEVMQALDQDQSGPTVEWKKIFEEDREFNQGEFAECLRDQFLTERIEFFTALETALYEEAGDSEECTKSHVVRAVLMTDPECSEKAAAAAVGGVFFPGVDTLSIKVVIKKLSRGILRGGTTDARGSEMPSGSGRNSNVGKASISAGKGRASYSAGGSNTAKTGLMATGRKQNEAIGRALEAVRLEWIQRQLKKGSEENGGDGAQGQRQRAGA